MVRHGDDGVTEMYLRSRLEGNWGSELGTLPADGRLRAIAGRAVPSK